MKKLFLTGALICGILVSPLYADDASKQQLVEEFLKLMDVDQQMNEMADGMKAMQEQQMASLAQTMPKDKFDQQKKASDEIMDEILKDLSWDATKGDFIKLYMEVFNEEDLKTLVDFYKSPVGQKVIAKTPELMQRSMQISQERMSKFIPRLQQLQNDIDSIPVEPAASVPAPATAPETVPPAVK